MEKLAERFIKAYNQLDYTIKNLYNFIDNEKISCYN